MIKIENKKILFIIAFLILPCLLFYLGMLMKSETGFYHLYSTDPVYAYLFDGLNICNFSWPFLVLGPGTPLSLFSSIVMGIVHLFRSQDPLITDVMKNPDVYLSAINTTLIAIQCMTLFILGFFVYKASNSLFTGLFFQLTPFVSWILIDIMRPILVENLIVISLLLLILLLYRYTKYQDKKSELLDRYLISFSILTGLIAATKLMYVTIAVIPFLLLPGYKKKGLYVIVSMIAFIILAFPIFNHWVEFRDFYINNFLHSGQYGQGPKTIISFNDYLPNLKSIFTTDRLFLKTYPIIVSGSILYYLPFLKIKEKNDKAHKILLGIAIIMTITILLVSKQFKFYYMTIALLLSIPGYYFVFSIFTRNISKRFKSIIAVPAVIILSYFLFHEVKTRVAWRPGNMIKKENCLNTMKYIQEKYDKDQPTLLIPNYYGAPYTAYGCFYGMGWCRGEIKNKYAEELKKIYPNIYSFHTWNNKFFHWDNTYFYIELLKKYNSIVLFSGDPHLENMLYHKLQGINRQIDTKIDTVITFEKTREVIYEVEYDSILGIEPFAICFNAEVLDNTGQFFVSKDGFKAGNANTQSADFARSGIYSGKLTKDNPYGMTISLSEVDTSDHYRISVWKYDNGNHDAGLVVAANDKEKLYLYNKNTSSNENNWHKIEIDLIIPMESHMQDLKIYCWNNDPELPAYFDDLSIERTE
ncbi:MAG: hypothetical protein JXK95_09285 [Bacteroidales bacterium]|nr:hypothetical protein [Bacteroidales bacterium]